MKDVTTENQWTFEFALRDLFDVAIHVIVRFMQRAQFNQQHQSTDTFYRPYVVMAQCVIGSDKYTEAGKFLIMLLISLHKHMEKFFPVLYI